MATKLTKKNYFEILKASYPTDKENYEEVMAFLDKEIALVDKKNASKSKADLAKAEANAKIADAVCDILADGTAYKCGDILKVLGDDNVSQNKLTSILTSLVKEGRIKREVIKGSAMFSL